MKLAVRQASDVVYHKDRYLGEVERVSAAKCALIAEKRRRARLRFKRAILAVRIANAFQRLANFKRLNTVATGKHLHNTKSH